MSEATPLAHETKLQNFVFVGYKKNGTPICRNGAPICKTLPFRLATRIDRGMVDRMFAFVRSYKPTRIAHIREAERHAKGENRSAQKRRRKDADARALAMALSPENCMSKPRVAYPTGHPQCPPEQPELDLEYAFSRYLDQESASVRKGAALGLHMIVGVSPEYFENEADRHNPEQQGRSRAAARCVRLGRTGVGRHVGRTVRRGRSRVRRGRCVL